MNRFKDITRVLDEIRNMENITPVQMEEIKVSMLSHIAVSLAVIADKLTEAEGNDE